MTKTSSLEGDKPTPVASAALFHLILMASGWSRLHNSVASAALFHLIASRLFDECPFYERWLKLSPEHARQLAKCGFDTPGYVSVPSPVGKLFAEAELNREFAAQLAQIHCAGIYFDGYQCRFNFPKGGLLVPVKNGRQIITGVQTYRHLADTTPAYLSSVGLPQGLGHTVSLHVARPEMLEADSCAWVTGHTLEADRCAWRYGVCAVALNRLLPQVLARQLRAALPKLKSVTLPELLTEVELLRALHGEGFTIVAQTEREVA